MGEVWKAEDLKLGRQVALKFLASHLVSDPEIHKRFEREAKAAASLSHPNICTVHEIDEADGKIFLVMELVKGESLEARIEKGPLSLNEALDIGRQVADGLQEAHAAGIVHRDIKPGNILIMPDGRAKILDFGLALLTEGSKLTKLDATVGTVAYMSPEQAQGGEVDHRSDIWALGCVLYEMVAGQRPFQGHYDQALVYSIINEEPEPLTAIRTGVPMDLEFVVSKALEKDPARRYQQVSEMVLDLENLRQKLASGRSAVHRSLPAAPAAPSMELSGYRVIEKVETKGDDSILYRAEDMAERRLVALRVMPESAVKQEEQKQKTTRSALWALAALSVILAAALSATLFSEGETPAGPVLKFSIEPADMKANSAVEISPDGRYVVYGGLSDEAQTLRLHDLATAETRTLHEASNLGDPAWSPDSRWIAFEEIGVGVKKVSIGGGAPVTVTASPESSRRIFGVAWSADGERIFFGVLGGLGTYSVPSGGGEAAVLLSSSGEPNRKVWPSVLPIEKGDALILTRGTSFFDTTLHLHDDRDGNVRDLGPGLKARYSKSGHLVYQEQAANSLWALPFSLEQLQPTGEAFRIAEIGSRPSVSVDGTLAYYHSDVSGSARLVLRDRDGQARGTVGQPQESIRYPTLSPDGSRVAVRGEENGNQDIWVHDTNRPVKTRLTFHEEVDILPVWSPSGRRISFSSGRGEGNRELFQRAADGSGDPIKLLGGETVHAYITDWSPDERFMLFYGSLEGVGEDLFTLRRKADGEGYEAVPYLSTQFNERTPKLSPDGRYVAYVSNESGEREVYVQRYPDLGGKRRVSTRGGFAPRWRRDGKELFFVQADTLVAVPVSASPELNFGEPEELFQSPGLSYRNDNVIPYDVFPDGERFVHLEPVDDTVRHSIRIVQNWYEEFRDRE